MTDPRRETRGHATLAGPSGAAEPATTPPHQEAPSRETPVRGTQGSLPGLGAAGQTRVPRRPNARGLLLGSPRAVLARLSCGDPLELRPLVAKRLRLRHLLMDAERVHLGALVRCAREGSSYSGQPSLARWLEQRVDLTIDEQLHVVEVAVASRPLASVWSELARPLGLSAEQMAAASASFNVLCADSRAAFFQLVLGGRSLDEWATSTGRSASNLARDARRALQVFLDATEPATSVRNPS